MSFERSWATTINIVGKPEPLGLIPIVAIPLYTGAVAISAALGIGAYQSVFGSNQATFDEGWKEGSVFDARMAALKQLWLKFDQQIQLRCPSFVKKDAGKWWRAFKTDLNEFGAFYSKVGTHKGYFTSWSSSMPASEQIGGAQARLSSLIGWGQAVESSCPGTFPSLGTLSPSKAEAAAAEQQAEAAKDKKGFFDSFGSNLGITLGVSAVGLGILAYIMRPRVYMGGAALHGMSVQSKRRQRRRAA